jgi:hypothetical protein
VARLSILKSTSTCTTWASDGGGQSAEIGGQLNQILKAEVILPERRLIVCSLKVFVTRV